MLENIGVPAIEKAVQAIYTMSADERTKELIRMREKALHDEASLIEESIDKGRAEERASIAEKMRADGVSEEIIKKYLS